MTIIVDDNGCHLTWHELKKTDDGWTAKHVDGTDCELVEFKVKESE